MTHLYAGKPWLDASGANLAGEVSTRQVRALRRRLTAAAEEAAVRVFASNLSALLMQRPVRGAASRNLPAPTFATPYAL